MSIRTVVQRGYGAGASIAFVVTRGYTIGTASQSSGVWTRIKKRDRRVIATDKKSL